MFLKQVTLQSRQRCTVVCQVLFPVLLVLGAAIPYLLLKNIDASGGSSNYPPYWYGGYVTWFEDDVLSDYQCFTGPGTNYRNCSDWYWDMFVPPSDPAQAALVGGAMSNGTGSGLLGNVPKYQYSSPLHPNVRVPYYTAVDNAADMDVKLLNAVNDVESAVKAQYSNGRWGPTPGPWNSTSWWYNEEDVYYTLPTTALIFDTFKAAPDNSPVELGVTIQLTLGKYSTYLLEWPGDGYRTDAPYATWMLTIHQLSMGLIRYLNPDFKNSVHLGFVEMFYVQDYDFSPAGFAAFIGAWLIPIAMSFLLPVYIYTLVYEKQNRLHEMMRIMGLNMFSYWFINYLFFYAMYVVVMLMIIIVGFACQVPFFIETDFIVWAILLVLWGHAQIALSFLLSTFFNKHRAATIISFFLVFIIGGGAMSINMFVYMNTEAPFLLMWYPTLAFCRGIYLISGGIYNIPAHPLRAADLTPDSEIAAVYGYLMVESVIYLLLAAYLECVLPREFGVRQSPFFPIKWAVKKVKELTSEPSTAYTDIDGDVVWSVPLADDFKEDADCAEERRKAHDVAVARDPKYLLRVVDINKTFAPLGGSGTKTALHSLCLAVERGECFGLLGPNGAGKSTLATILSGLIAPTSGTAYVAGHSIREDMYKVHQVLGYCPQHDILWEDLTIEEHLLFYIRLKGNVAHADEKRLVHEAIESVNLLDKATAQVKTLSGGQKRRLSIAISLVGTPKLVLLDEPTTGLDPETRREIWNIISDQKASKSIILTTHNMEEADVLCSRIGIVTKGLLTCIGTPMYLKTRYGKGYHLSITTVDARSEAAALKYIKNLFPNAELESTFSGVLSLQIPREDMKLGPFFEEIRRHKQENGIQEWGLSQTTIEEVFLKIVHDAATES